MRLLANHPEMSLVGAFASSNAKSTPLDEIHPLLKGLTSLTCEPFDPDTVKRLAPEVIFLATPNEFSHEIVPSMLDTGATVIDVSGAFRLRNASDYSRYYGFEHTRPDLLKTRLLWPDRIRA